MSTATVLRLIKIAPIAGLIIMPAQKRTPALVMPYKNHRLFAEKQKNQYLWLRKAIVSFPIFLSFQN
jgi:hypothetical protein